MPSFENWNESFDWSAPKDQGEGATPNFAPNVTAYETPVGQGSGGVGSEAWRYGYMPSSTPGLRPPSQNYGEDYLTPVLKQYPGISSGAISELAKVPTYNAPMPPGLGGYTYTPSPMNALRGESQYIGLDEKLSKQLNVPGALHEYAHTQSVPQRPFGRKDWGYEPWNQFMPDTWEPFVKTFQSSPGAQEMWNRPEFWYGRTNPIEAYAEMAQLNNAQLEQIPPELRPFYWWLR